MRFLAQIWWGIVALCDWHTWMRKLRGQPALDVACISNLRDLTDRKRSFGFRKPTEGHVNGPRYWFKDVTARIRVIDSLPKNLKSPNGRTVAKEQFESAVCWAQRNGVLVVLFAAGTKRLFGEKGEQFPKILFPGVLFTIGDNGTTYVLLKETLRAFASAKIFPGGGKICVIGPTGFLGEAMVTYLVAKGFVVVGLCSNVGSVAKCLTEAYTSFEDVGKVDAVVACTHADNVLLTRETAEVLKKEGRKLLVVDVCEPSNMTRKVYGECRDIVIRQDAGNAYSPDLDYVMGAISYKMLRMTQGVVFGCFAEALVLAAELKAGNRSVLDIDWLTVSQENLALIGKLFAKYGFDVPSPRSFGEAVESFDVRIPMEFRSQESILLKT